MRYKEISTNVELDSWIWMDSDEDGAARPFIRAGFTNTEELMELRVFDMLNIFKIDRIMAEEMVYALYRFFNENKKADGALYAGIIDQYFDFAEWKGAHPDASKVLVKDIIMSAGVNLDAVTQLFDRVVRKFWRSPEYNSRQYRYWGYKDIVQQREGEKTK